MELFDTQFVYLGRVLLVSGLKMLVVSKQPLPVSGELTTILRPFSEHLPQKQNKNQIMNVHTKQNSFCLIWSSITCVSPEKANLL